MLDDPALFLARLARAEVHVLLPNVKSLSSILPDGAEGGAEFARILDLLLIRDAKSSDAIFTSFNDSSGDFGGLDSFSESLRRSGTTGFQYRFYKSPLSDSHRHQIKQTITTVAENAEQLKLKKLVIVTPDDLTENARKKGGGDLTWFRKITKDLAFKVEHLGHTKIVDLMLAAPSVALFYYPQLVRDGASTQRSILETRKLYDDNLSQLHHNIEFVGMSVYKPDATRGIPMESIYIPLRLQPFGSTLGVDTGGRVDPIKMLRAPGNYVVLGDPGSGKSTLLRFLMLSGISPQLQERYGAPKDDRLTILVTLRKYADAIKKKASLSLVSFIVETTKADFSLSDANISFFEYYLKTGHAIVLFDGLDELPSPEFKETVRDRIRSFSTSYPNNTVVVTTRIVGYDSPFKFSDKEFAHVRVAELELPEIKTFVEDWYKIRIENYKDREENVQDLVRIVKDEENTALRALARNPLLLTIIALVHRIDAVLPDERVVLYQKCTETLLNTWHTWKFREVLGASRGRIERRNRRRIEAIANWMHRQSGGTRSGERAVTTYADLKGFLTSYISKEETSLDGDIGPEDRAEEFLEFVRKRAGLLIEVGDGQYSFLHLTFQEYLTASYLIAEGEPSGIETVWREIARHSSDPRWHEVIRLLTGELRTEKSQAYIVKMIIAQAGAGVDFHCISLLAGILIDGVIAAVEHEATIVECIVRAAILLRDESQVSALLTSLRKICAKRETNKNHAVTALNHVAAELGRPIDKLGAALIGTALSWQPQTNCTKLAKASRSTGSQWYLALFCGGPLPYSAQAVCDVFALLQFAAMMTSPGLNALSAILVRTNFMISAEFGWRTLWRSLLYALIQGLGPLFDFTMNIAYLYGGATIEPAQLESAVRVGAKRGLAPPGLHGVWRRRIDQPIERKLQQQATTDAQIEIANMIRHGSGRQMFRATLAWNNGPGAGQIYPATPGSELMGLASWSLECAEFVTGSLGLAPAAQWREALRGAVFSGENTRGSALDLSLDRAVLLSKSEGVNAHELGSVILYNAALESIGVETPLRARLESGDFGTAKAEIVIASIEAFNVCAGRGNASRLRSAFRGLDDVAVPARGSGREPGSRKA